MKCYRCEGQVSTDGSVTRSDTCTSCGAYLHCCKNCAFYDKGAHNRCREPQSEWVTDREGANFCEFFTFSQKAAGKDKKLEEETRRQLNELFKKE